MVLLFSWLCDLDDRFSLFWYLRVFNGRKELFSSIELRKESIIDRLLKNNRICVFIFIIVKKPNSTSNESQPNNEIFSYMKLIWYRTQIDLKTEVSFSFEREKRFGSFFSCFFSNLKLTQKRRFLQFFFLQFFFSKNGLLKLTLPLISETCFIS